MLNYIWGAIMIISFICAVITGRMPELSASVMQGASNSIDLVISMLGMMCFWTGLMKIADEGGITNILAKFFYPITRYLFPNYSKDSNVSKAICMNITANILGLGNAATPLGIKAMKEMNKLNLNKGVADNNMVMFLVINTASIQLIPTFMSILRQKHGALNPLDILPSVWITSICALIVGITVAKLLEHRGNRIEQNR